MKKLILFVICAVLFAVSSVNAQTNAFVGKFESGYCLDNACDCGICAYTFVNAEGGEITINPITKTELLDQVTELTNDNKIVYKPEYVGLIFYIIYEDYKCKCYYNDGNCNTFIEVRIVSIRIL